ncbi:related to Mig2 protein [Sporisorium scitamineum]|uniref:Related to Mig2 protein n=1 Tax=Sporisorium scitamineum TaxID=49012 RepID=A0A0F7RX38_9BASI|nr:hypothetical protein [Sporisorium scitamineum]CDU24642.1 related to Mig2 protein [Sporisorium scitamineum]
MIFRNSVLLASVSVSLFLSTFSTTNANPIKRGVEPFLPDGGGRSGFGGNDAPLPNFPEVKPHHPPVWVEERSVKAKGETGDDNCEGTLPGFPAPDLYNDDPPAKIEKRQSGTLDEAEHDHHPQVEKPSVSLDSATSEARPPLHDPYIHQPPAKRAVVPISDVTLEGDKSFNTANGNDGQQSIGGDGDGIKKRSYDNPHDGELMGFGDNGDDSGHQGFGEADGEIMSISKRSYDNPPHGLGGDDGDEDEKGSAQIGRRDVGQVPRIDDPEYSSREFLEATRGPVRHSVPLVKRGADDDYQGWPGGKDEDNKDKGQAELERRDVGHIPNINDQKFSKVRVIAAKRSLGQEEEVQRRDDYGPASVDEAKWQTPGYSEALSKRALERRDDGDDSDSESIDSIGSAEDNQKFDIAEPHKEDDGHAGHHAAKRSLGQEQRIERRWGYSEADANDAVQPGESGSGRALDRRSYEHSSSGESFSDDNGGVPPAGSDAGNPNQPPKGKPKLFKRDDLIKRRTVFVNPTPHPPNSEYEGDDNDDNDRSGRVGNINKRDFPIYAPGPFWHHASDIPGTPGHVAKREVHVRPGHVNGNGVRFTGAKRSPPPAFEPAVAQLEHPGPFDKRSLAAEHHSELRHPINERRPLPPYDQYPSEPHAKRSLSGGDGRAAGEKYTKRRPGNGPRRPGGCLDSVGCDDDQAGSNLSNPYGAKDGDEWRGEDSRNPQDFLAEYNAAALRSGKLVEKPPSFHVTTNPILVKAKPATFSKRSEERGLSEDTVGIFSALMVSPAGPNGNTRWYGQCECPKGSRDLTWVNGKPTDPSTCVGKFVKEATKYAQCTLDNGSKSIMCVEDGGREGMTAGDNTWWEQSFCKRCVDAGGSSTKGFACPDGYTNSGKVNPGHGAGAKVGDSEGEPTQHP